MGQRSKILIGRLAPWRYRDGLEGEKRNHRAGRAVQKSVAAGVNILRDVGACRIYPLLVPFTKNNGTR